MTKARRYRIPDAARQAMLDQGWTEHEIRWHFGHLDHEPVRVVRMQVEAPKPSVPPRRWLRSLTRERFKHLKETP